MQSRGNEFLCLNHQVTISRNELISDFFLIFLSQKLDNISEKDEPTDSRLEKTETGVSSGSSSDSEDDLGTSASVQEEKREFEAGLSDLRHKLAQEVIMEEEEG